MNFFTQKDGRLDWRAMQTLVRSMPDFHKTLILADIRTCDDGTYSVEELAMTTEHAPFRHKKITLDNHIVGAQVKNK